MEQTLDRTNFARLINAEGELHTALAQALDSDDPIMVGHMREAHALVAAVLRNLRDARKQLYEVKYLHR